MSYFIVAKLYYRVRCGSLPSLSRNLAVANLTWENISWWWFRGWRVMTVNSYAKGGYWVRSFMGLVELSVRCWGLNSR